MKPLPLLLAVLLFGIGTSCTDRTDRHQKALEELDRIIERRDAYGRTKNLRIAARRDELAAAKDPRKRIALAEEICTQETLREQYPEYTHRIFHIFEAHIDSAYHYARRMLALAQSYGDGTRINCARVYLAKTVLNGGMYGEAFRILHQVDTTRLAPANKSEYYNVYRSYLSKQLSGADPALAMFTGIFAGLAIGLSAFFQGKVAAASADALGETGKGTANFFIVIGIIETVALFTLVFSLLLLQ